MTTLTRIVAVVGGIALLAAPAFSQDVPRRQDPGTGAPAGPPPFGGRRGFGGFRGAMPPVPRVGPVEGFQDTPFQKTIDNLGERGTIDVSNTVGQVRIIGTQGNSVKITATKRVKTDDRNAAQAMMQNIIIRVTERGGGIEVFTELPSAKLPPNFVDYDIAVPMNASVSVRSQGSIFVTNLKGELRAEAFTNDMVLTSVARVRRAKTFTGNLFVNGSEGEELTAEVGGALRMNNVRVRNIETRTIAGGVMAFDVDCDRCTFQSFSGNIDLIGALRRNARYDVSTNSGNIRVVVPDGPVGFDLDATTAGVLRSDFQPLKSTAPPAPASANRFLRGTYGDGSAILSLKSFTGSITVTRPMPGSGGR